MEIKERMLRLFSTHKKNIFLIGGCLILFSVLLMTVYKMKKPDVPQNEDYSITLNTPDEDAENQEVITKISVDIKGLVVKPGVYEMDSNQRVNHVIEAAGGLSKNANTKYINLSKKLFDEMVIIIYSNDEIKEFESKEIVENECICEDTINDACIESKTNNDDKKYKEAVLVNINTATLEQLLTLSGIGESKAKAIIEYRNNEKKFDSIEDIKEVSGIGESVYSKIKDFITTE